MVVEICHFASAPPQTSSVVLKGASPAPASLLPLLLDLTLNLFLDHLTSYSERRYSFNFIPIKTHIYLTAAIVTPLSKRCDRHDAADDFANYKVSGKRHAQDGFTQRARWKSNAQDGNPKKRPRHVEVKNPSSALLPRGAGRPLDLTKNIIPAGACHCHP